MGTIWASPARAGGPLALEDVVEPLPEQAEQRRQEQPRDAAREGERPSEQRRLVGEHTDRAHECLGGEGGEDRPCRGAVLQEGGRDREEEEGATGQGPGARHPDTV